MTLTFSDIESLQRAVEVAVDHLRSGADAETRRDDGQRIRDIIQGPQRDGFDIAVGLDPVLRRLIHDILTASWGLAETPNLSRMVEFSQDLAFYVERSRTSATDPDKIEEALATLDAIYNGVSAGRPAVEQVTTPDGPDEDRPGWFNWKGKPLKTSTTTWKLLLCIFDEQSVDFATVSEHLWGRDDAPSASIRSAVSRLNEFFAEECVPVSFSCTAERITRNN